MVPGWESVIRVGFVFSFADQGWLGGINYFRNLLEAVSKLPDRQIEPVILTGHKVDPKLLAGFPPVQIIQSRLLDHRHPLWYGKRVLKRIAGFDLALEWLCKRNNIQTLSHSGFLRPDSGIKTLAWIFDFQHVRMPEWFDQTELKLRDRVFAGDCRYCHRVILSSKDAQRDLAANYPDALVKSRVLNFTTSLGKVSDAPPLEGLRKKYDLPEKFFHLPNQFWIHKNHKVVVLALAELRRRGHPVTVVCTGNTRDHRHPGYFSSLMAQVESAGVQDLFRPLGIIPYSEMRSLMTGSVALINPSLFEGWSSTVEEAKALGKQMILSSIPVHLEQAPYRGVYFSPNDPVALADSLWNVFESYDPHADRDAMNRATEVMDDNIRKFGQTYQDIVLELTAGPS